MLNSNSKLRLILVLALSWCALLNSVLGVNLNLNDLNSLAMPQVGAHGLKVIAPTVVELTLVNTKAPAPASFASWNFVGANHTLTLPAASEFDVRVNGQSVAVQSVGFKRRPIYAPLKVRDLRVGNHIYLKLASAIPDNATVEVRNPSASLWGATSEFKQVASAARFNPAIHVNQAGYAPNWPKKATVGYYLGSMGELTVAATSFAIVRANDNVAVFNGTLRPRLDEGFTYSEKPYQKVLEADFTALTTPGAYKLQVPGMGVSYAFRIDEGAPAQFARAFALGLFHQRCGCKLDSPFTRHQHEACHVADAEVLTMANTKQQEFIAGVSADFANEPRHTAPQLRNVDTGLYPSARQGNVNVSGGHHDAGDYSKYTINSAGLVHFLIFAADAFPGAGALDNLGLPESGDGKSDLLQEAKWEADFLAKMQDGDGGFYFLVYPKDRKYEDDVQPDKGDAQVLWPKTTAVTAAAVAALAEAGSSPLFKQQFPTEAALYLSKAQAGWAFLERAIAEHGKDGAYQKLTHYGHEFMHDDELAWAAAAMYAATGNPVYHAKLKEWFPNPNDPNTRRWSWWRMFEGYGNAIRTYAFAARSGRLSAAQLDAAYLAKCDAEIVATADDHVRFSRQSSYGTSFPDLNKQYRTAGWYFSSERAFDVTVGYQVTPKPEYLETVVANLNYEAGSNPINQSYITGIGWRQQRDIVHQAAQTDHRVLPPTGIPLGNIQPGFSYLYHYGSELGGLAYPPDGATSNPYPYYDRWGDTFNTMTEFVVMDQARSLASTAFWMANSSVKTQAWRGAAAQINGLPAQSPAETTVTATLAATGLDLSTAHVVWEARDQEPFAGPTFTFAPKFPGEQWVEVEATLPDGRRVFAKTTFIATTSESAPPNPYKNVSAPIASDVTAAYKFDTTLVDAASKQPAMTTAGNTTVDISNLGWMTTRTGGAIRFLDIGDTAQATIPASAFTGANAVTFEGMIYINSYKGWNRAAVPLMSLSSGWNAQLELREDMYAGAFVRGGSQFSVSGATLNNALTTKVWHHLSITIAPSGYTLKVNGTTVATMASGELSNWGSAPAKLELGNFDGWIDEAIVRVDRSGSVNASPTATLTAPAANQTVNAPATINLAASATDADGTIAKVEFFNGANKLGEDTSAPYTFTWSGVPIGVYSVSARATDNLGAVSANSARTITVSVPANTPPVVLLTSPLLNATFTAPATVTLAATATDLNGSIAKVEFFQGTTKIGEDLTAPYTFSWARVAAGAYQITARATDNLGATASSAPIAIGVLTAANGLIPCAKPVITPGTSDFNSSVVATVTCETPGVSLRYTTDGTAVNSKSPLYKGPLTFNSTTTLRVRAYKLGLDRSLETTAVFTRNANAPAGNSATFVRSDSSTSGNWRGIYGSEGYRILGDATSNPAYAAPALSGGNDYTWSDGTSDTRALERADGSGRVVRTYYSATTELINLNFTDTQSHRVSLYCLDWDRGGRIQTVDVLDAVTGAVLNSQTLSNFENGKYLVWDLTGKVQLRVTRTAGANGLFMALFFDPTTGVLPPPNTAQSAQSPEVNPLGLENGRFWLEVVGKVGVTYHIQASENLSDWATIQTVTLPETEMTVVDETAGQSARRFYRLVAAGQ